MALAVSDPLMRLQDTLQSDWRIEQLLNELTFAIADNRFLSGPLPNEDVEVLFEELMNKKDREAYRRKKERHAIIEAINRALRRRALPRPKWRWIDAGYSNEALGPEYLLRGRQLFRAAASSIVWLARLRITTLKRRKALAPTESADQRSALGVYSHLSVHWLGIALERVLDSLWDDDVQLDLYAPPSAEEWAAAGVKEREKRKGLGPRGGPPEHPLLALLGCGFKDARHVARARSFQLQARVKALLDSLGSTLDTTAERTPPVALRAFWARLTSDGMYFPPHYLTTPERLMVSQGPFGAARWMRPLRLQAPNLAADTVLISKLRPDPAMQSGALQPAAGPNTFRLRPVPGIFRYTDEDQAAAAAVRKGRRHSAADLGMLHLRSWAGEDRGVLVYGSRAAGDFRRVECVLSCAVILRACIAALLLQAKPGPPRVRRAQAQGEDLRQLLHRGRCNARVLASSLYYMLGRILPGLMPGTFPPAALGAGVDGQWEALKPRPEEPAAGAGVAVGARVSSSRGAGEEEEEAPSDSSRSAHASHNRSGKPFTFGDGMAQDVANAVKLHEQEVMRTDAVLRLEGKVPPASLGATPFEKWLATQMLPPSYFHGGSVGARGPADRHVDATVVDVHTAALHGDGDASGEAPLNGLAMDRSGRIDPRVIAHETESWLEAEETHTRLIMAALTRFVLTHAGGPKAGLADGQVRAGDIFAEDNFA